MVQMEINMTNLNAKIKKQQKDISTKDDVIASMEQMQTEKEDSVLHYIDQINRLNAKVKELQKSTQNDQNDMESIEYQKITNVNM